MKYQRIESSMRQCFADCLDLIESPVKQQPCYYDIESGKCAFFTFINLMHKMVNNAIFLFITYTHSKFLIEVRIRTNSNHFGVFSWSINANGLRIYDLFIAPIILF
jgi:hypothetical protein